MRLMTWNKGETNSATAGARFIVATMIENNLKGLEVINRDIEEVTNMISSVSLRLGSIKTALQTIIGDPLTLSYGRSESLGNGQAYKTEIGLAGLIKAGVKFIFDRVNWKDNKESNTGNYSAATNTGYRSAATNTGDRSAATNTGDRSAAEVSGKESVAIVTGKDCKARGTICNLIVLTERGEWDGNT